MNLDNSAQFLPLYRPLWTPNLTPDSSGSEEHKLELFYCHLAPGGIAEQWYEDLRETELDTWAQLVDAFKIRWPKPSYTLSMADAIAIMREQKIITIDELGKYIELHHRPISTHAYWARDIYFLAQRLDVHDAIASEIRDKLPRPLRGFVDPDVETWADFRDQMEKVSMRALREALADFKETEEQG
ncbi:hypothetical protein A0H81_01904 [Grifola frondosa]|uniref:Retrotransposon gag domain-containing protein n=1 Tax=Grifola frondosa TaxID=5627 RepID=A0A1C7MNH1_GRIFR|nr:hypothetical protein A0H81_01904 [Grifola frondosa]